MLLTFLRHPNTGNKNGRILQDVFPTQHNDLHHRICIWTMCAILVPGTSFAQIVFFCQDGCRIAFHGRAVAMDSK